MKNDLFLFVTAHEDTVAAAHGVACFKECKQVSLEGGFLRKLIEVGLQRAENPPGIGGDRTFLRFHNVEKLVKLNF